MLAYITGTVDQELLLRNEYLAAENRILKAQLKTPLRLTDAERMTLAEIAYRLGRKALEDGNCQGNCRLDGLTHAAFSNVSVLSLSSDLSGFKYTSSTGSQFRVSRLQRSGCRAFAAS